MYRPFYGGSQHALQNPYQTKLSCQFRVPDSHTKAKPRQRHKVIHLKAPKPKVNNREPNLHRVLVVASHKKTPVIEVNTQELPQPDASELTQDLIAAENLPHVYAAEAEHFPEVSDLLASLESSKKPYT